MKMNAKHMSEERFQTRLADLLENAMESRGGFVTSFADDGILTSNHGLVVHMGNGQEFQITIVDSTRG